MGRKWGREGECHARKGQRVESNPGCCSEDTAPVGRTSALPTELPVPRTNAINVKPSTLLCHNLLITDLMSFVTDYQVEQHFDDGPSLLHSVLCLIFVKIC